MRDKFIIDGLTVREALVQFEEVKDEIEKQAALFKKQGEKSYKYDTKLNSVFWGRCSYNKILEDDQQRAKSTTSKKTPMQILIQQQFLRDQGKTKKAEAAWFEKLEDELDRIEMDEALLKYKIENSKKR